MNTDVNTFEVRAAARFSAAPTQRRRKHGPQVDPEWHRIWGLPRRPEWDEASIADAVEAMSAELRRPGSQETLFPVQAMALVEIAMFRGLVGALRVGAGKTLISLLASRVVGARRPLLILPAKLQKKTHAEAQVYRRDWQIERVVTISIEKLRRVNQADFLSSMQPDLIVIDEGHKLANHKASAARRIDRYLDEHPTPVVVLTGTLADASLDQFAHLVRWAHGENAPVPMDATTTALWSDALAEPPSSRLGAFTRFGSLADARAAYRDRIFSSPGMLLTEDSHPGELYVEMWGARPSEQCLQAIESVEKSWVLPDGQELADPLQMAAAVYTLALGYWMRWRVPGPPEWMTARSEWARFVREQVAIPRKLDPIDTEEQCKKRVLEGQLQEGEDILRAWEAVRPTFVPETLVEWVDDSAVSAILDWARQPGVIWYRHKAIGEALGARGIAHYGRKGLDRHGRPIENARPDEACVASARSSAEGRNLQQFNRCLVLEPPSKATPWEQLIGRLHRPGQRRPVYVDVYAPTGRHTENFDRAMRSAHFVEQSIGQPQKLLQAKTQGKNNV